MHLARDKLKTLKSKHFSEKRQYDIHLLTKLYNFAFATNCQLINCPLSSLLNRNMFGISSVLSPFSRWVVSYKPHSETYKNKHAECFLQNCIIHSCECVYIALLDSSSNRIVRSIHCRIRLKMRPYSTVF